MPFSWSADITTQEEAATALAAVLAWARLQSLEERRYWLKEFAHDLLEGQEPPPNPHLCPFCGD